MKRKRWIVAAVIVFLAVGIGVLTDFGRNGWRRIVMAPASQVQGVSYPKEADTAVDENLMPEGPYLKSLKSFYQETMNDVLTRDPEKSVAYSPINLYLCMAMLTEMTGGNTQEQLLSALGQKSVDDVRKKCQEIWKGVYADNDSSKCILGNSVWLNDEIPYEKDVLEVLSKYYYASSYQGKMGTEAMNKDIRDWVNSMTGNMLKEQAGEIESDSETVLMLLSSAYFYDQWSEPFPEGNTEKDKFHNADGSLANCEMMMQVNSSSFYQEERFTSTALSFEKGKNMHIFLPAEGTTIEEMLQEDIEEILNISAGTSEKSDWGEVTLYLPKFEITTSHMNLIPTMKHMGVTEVLESGGADFGKLLGDNLSQELEVYLDKAEQSTKVAVDEKGCSVASFTEMDLKCGSAMPEKECTIKCNRPFLFVISDGESGLPVFVGVVNEM